MKRRIGIAIGLLFALGHEAGAQEKAGPAAVRATSSGVYTTAQARMGEDVYAGMCTGCHTTASHSGDAFSNVWAGRPLSELYVFIKGGMPKTEPGSLAPEEYAAIVAYLLKLNGMPAGKQALPADSAALDRIRIDPKQGS